MIFDAKMVVLCGTIHSLMIPVSKRIEAFVLTAAVGAAGRPLRKALAA